MVVKLIFKKKEPLPLPVYITEVRLVFKIKDPCVSSSQVAVHVVQYFSTSFDMQTHFQNAQTSVANQTSML